MSDKLPQTLYSNHIAAISANITLTVTNSVQFLVLLITNLDSSELFTYKDITTLTLTGIIIVVSILFIIWAAFGMQRESSFEVHSKKKDSYFYQNFFNHFQTQSEEDKLIVGELGIENAKCFKCIYFKNSLTWLYIFTLILIIIDAVGDSFVLSTKET